MARQRSNRIIGGETFYALPGTARNFADSQGNIYSRRSIDALQAGKKARSQAKPLDASKSGKQSRRAKAGEYKFAVNAWKKNESIRTGVPVDKIKVRGNSESAQRFKQEWNAVKNSKEKSAALNEFLVNQNIRQPGKRPPNSLAVIQMLFPLLDESGNDDE